jgi:hypothetical protein
MQAYLTLRNAVMAAVVGILIALSWTGVAQAVTDAVFRYSAPKTGYFAIDVMAMSPSSDNSDYHNDWELLRTVSGGLSCFNAAVNLPSGATITGLAVYYQSAAATNPDFHLRRHAFTDGQTNIIAAKAVLNDTNQRTVANVPIDAAFAVVNTTQYSYGFGVCLGSPTDAFYSARIRYTYYTAGD